MLRETGVVTAARLGRVFVGEAIALCRVIA